MLRYAYDPNGNRLTPEGEAHGGGLPITATYEPMMINKFDLTLSRPMHENASRALGLPPGTCRLLIATRQNVPLLLAQVLARGFGPRAPISVRAEGPFKPIAQVIEVLGGAIEFDDDALSVANAEQLATVLTHWRAEELVIVPCDLACLSTGMAPAGSMFKLTPSGHMYRYAPLIDKCGPIANYSPDHESLECFGTEDQIMALHATATAVATADHRPD